MSQSQDLASLAAEMGITRDELRSRIIRALQLAGVVPMELIEDPRAERIVSAVTIDVRLDGQGKASYTVVDPVTGGWRPL